MYHQILVEGSALLAVLPTGSLTTSLPEGSSYSWGFLGAAEGEPQPMRQLWRRPINYANPRWQGHRSWISFPSFPLFFNCQYFAKDSFFSFCLDVSKVSDTPSVLSESYLILRGPSRSTLNSARARKFLLFSKVFYEYKAGRCI